MPYVLCPTLNTLIIDEQEIDAALDESIKEFLGEIFPDWKEVFCRHRQWHKMAPVFTTLCRVDERIVGHVAVVVRAITTTWNHRYYVASIQGVAVDPEYRHSGLAHQLLTETLAEARRRGFVYAILYCKEPLVEFYASQGWKLPDDHTVMRNEEDQPISMRSNCPMYYELTDEPFPEGPLDVHSFQSRFPESGGPP